MPDPYLYVFTQHFWMQRAQRLPTMMFCCAVLLLLAGCVNVGTSQLIINEIMIDSVDASNRNTNWVELYNTANRTIALNGWKMWPCVNRPICDVSDRKAFVTTASIGPFGYVIVGNNNNTATNGRIRLDVLFSTLGLWPANGTGRQALGLYSPSNSLNDVIYWSTNQSKAQYLPLPFSRGASVARICPTSRTRDVTNWKTSTTLVSAVKGTDDKGTPGRFSELFCPTKIPTRAPTKTKTPTKSPTSLPATTKAPTKTPVKAPSIAPTKDPTKVPTSQAPTMAPTITSTMAPTKTPTTAPVNAPNNVPTKTPPTKVPTRAPTTAPTRAPPVKTPTRTPIKAAPTIPVGGGGGGGGDPTTQKCGLFKLGIMCLNGCSFIGTIFGLCGN